MTLTATLTAAPITAAPTKEPATRRPVSPLPQRELLDAAALIRLGFAVDEDGIGAHEDAAQMLVDAATRKGLCPVLIQILADRHEPSVARQRAFGRLALALAN
jgi:hypothetical protein